MTQLTIIPKIADKTARFKGTIAAGEHVAVVIENADGGIGSTDNLRLRIVGYMGETLAEFPQSESADPSQESTSETTDNEWESSGGVISCIFNLDTANLLAAVPPAATMSLLFVLDDAESGTLYFKDRCDVVHWPQRRGEDNPVDLRGYRDFVEETKRRVNEAVAAAQAAQDAAEHTPGMPGPQGPRGIQGTPAPCWKMRGPDGKWHNVGLSANKYGALAVEVDQSQSPPEQAGDDDVSFNALTGPEQVDEETGALVRVPNTELRELTDRFADEWNVADFGADPTGVSNSSVAIQHAIDAAQPGDRVVFPNGTYKMNQAVTINKSGITIDGRGSKILAGTHLTYIFLVRGSVGEVVKNLVASANVTEEEAGATANDQLKLDDVTDVNVGDWYLLTGQRDAFDPYCCGIESCLGAATSGTQNIPFAEPVCVAAVEKDAGEGVTSGTIWLQEGLVFKDYRTDRSKEPTYPFNGIDDPGGGLVEVEVDGVTKSYSTGTRAGSTLTKLNFVSGVVIKNLTFECSGYVIYKNIDNLWKHSQRGVLRFEYCKDCVVENIAVDYKEGLLKEEGGEIAGTGSGEPLEGYADKANPPVVFSGITALFKMCYGCTLRDSRISRCAADGYFGRGLGVHDYTSVKCITTWYQKIESCVLDNGVQTVDFTYNTSNRGVPPGITGPNILPLVTNCSFHGFLSQGVTTHGGTLGLRVSGCEFDFGFPRRTKVDETVPVADRVRTREYQNVEGVNTRSPRLVVENCTFHGGGTFVVNNAKYGSTGVMFQASDVYTGTSTTADDLLLRSGYSGSVVKGCLFNGLLYAVRFEQGYPLKSISSLIGVDVSGNEMLGCDFAATSYSTIAAGISNRFREFGSSRFAFSGNDVRGRGKTTALNLRYTNGAVVSGNRFSELCGSVEVVQVGYSIDSLVVGNSFLVDDKATFSGMIVNGNLVRRNLVMGGSSYNHVFAGNYTNCPEKAVKQRVAISAPGAQSTQYGLVYVSSVAAEAALKGFATPLEVNCAWRMDLKNLFDVSGDVSASFGTADEVGSGQYEFNVIKAFSGNAFSDRASVRVEYDPSMSLPVMRGVFSDGSTFDMFQMYNHGGNFGKTYSLEVPDLTNPLLCFNGKYTRLYSGISDSGTILPGSDGHIALFDTSDYSYADFVFMPYDRCVNKLSLSSSLSVGALTFEPPPALLDGTLRDFYVRLTLAKGMSAPSSISLVSLEGEFSMESSDGQFPTVATSEAGPATTLLHFVETDTRKFRVTGTELKTIGGGS